jgi:hypothetical protein
MSARLGNVLYWASCIIAGLPLYATWIDGNFNNAGLVMFSAAISVVIWLIGRACRYVLAGC